MGLRRIWRAARYSAQGLRAAFRGEAAFRQELLIALVAAPLGLWLGRSAAERALLLGSLLLTLIVELLIRPWRQPSIALAWSAMSCLAVPRTWARPRSLWP